LLLALALGFVLWRYFKSHEDNLLSKAELEMAKHSRCRSAMPRKDRAVWHQSGMPSK
jgi:hypothetical protein